MLEYELDIEARSVWNMATPSPAALSMPFYLTEAGLFYAGSRFYTRREGKAGYYLLYSRAGEGLMELRGEELRIPAGHALLMDCEEYHFYRTGSAPWVNQWVHLDGPGAAAYHALLENKVVPLLRPRSFGDVLEELLELALQADALSAARASQALSTLLTDLVASRMAPGAGKEGEILHDGVRSAVEFIRNHYQSPISIDDITRSAGLSKFHFVRVFSRYTGVTPYHYLILHRINQSKRLLCTTGLSVAQIAARTGYLSESNYIRQFSRLTGTTPARFRRQNIFLGNPDARE